MTKLRWLPKALISAGGVTLGTLFVEFIFAINLLDAEDKVKLHNHKQPIVITPKLTFSGNPDVGFLRAPDEPYLSISYPFTVVTKEGKIYVVRSTREWEEVEVPKASKESSDKIRP